MPAAGAWPNFYMDKVLGGDIIVEQNIHVIDVANRLLQGNPTKAYGSGGTHRLARHSFRRR
jgi:predicted dehydrogenase